MSAGASTAGSIGGRTRRPRVQAHTRAAPAERPFLRLVTFTALAGYGLVRWATLMRPEPGWRLIGLLALAVALAGAVPVISRYSRGAAAGASVVILLLAFPVSGLRWHWLKHMSIARTADRIEHGLNLLPNTLVPYLGSSADVRLVIVLGAAVLVLDAAAVLAFAGGSRLGDGRRAAAALPLIALAVVPSTLIRPELPYMQGLLLFGLLAAFMWGERVRAGAAGSAIGIIALAGVAGAIAAPRIDQRSPWVDYRAWAGTAVPVHVDTFNWNQTYGPLRWPQNGHEVFTVTTSRSHGDYWKAEDLDTFNGTSWVVGSPPGPALPAPSGDALSRWTKTIRVSIVGMKTPDVIAAGEAGQPPASLPGGVAQGADAGTWQSGTPMGPGTSYSISVYSPEPSPHELATAGRDYPSAALAADLTLQLPVTPTSVGTATVPVTFPLFHSHKHATVPAGTAALPHGIAAPPSQSLASVAVGLSPYGHAYALAQRLAAKARTPYAFVMSVRNYLSEAHGFTYNQTPPVHQYPLASFLSNDKEGYCQQFSGAMAMLLRMGGIPARVAAGFTPGIYDRQTASWVVSDIDAHAWVEAWFPNYGWVRFDPTPTTAPARGGTAIEPILKKLPGGSTGTDAALGRRDATPTSTATAHHHGAGGGGTSVWWLVAIGLALLVVLAWLARRLMRDHIARSDLLAELERALARTGRPLQDGMTLVGIEHRLHGSPDAEAYVRTLRLSRYGGDPVAPSAAQRRALRRELGRGLGFIGRLRALWALPPRL
ncbi:MAG TPA: transglutaminase domain-containing protein [Solirubrobacteraceae bacterium]|nr:transglutaminase domain-containing protein [Solirubrobacteraceae bacterium]